MSTIKKVINFSASTALDIEDAYCVDSPETRPCFTLTFIMPTILEDARNPWKFVFDNTFTKIKFA